VAHDHNSQPTLTSQQQAIKQAGAEKKHQAIKSRSFLLLHSLAGTFLHAGAPPYAPLRPTGLHRQRARFFLHQRNWIICFLGAFPHASRSETGRFSLSPAAKWFFHAKWLSDFCYLALIEKPASANGTSMGKGSAAAVA
jgi:hypothetical protein